MIEWAATSIGQQQVVPAQWCVSAKQHNMSGARWAGDGPRVEINLTSRVVLAQVPDILQDRQPRLQQGTTNLVPQS